MHLKIQIIRKLVVHKKNFIANELKNRLFIIIILTLCLWIFIFSCSYATFDTGARKLNLNDGEPVEEYPQPEPLK